MKLPNSSNQDTLRRVGIIQDNIDIVSYKLRDLARDLSNITLPDAKEWLANGGAGHEGGEEGIKAATVNGLELIRILQLYQEYAERSLILPNSQDRT